MISCCTARLPFSQSTCRSRQHAACTVSRRAMAESPSGQPKAVRILEADTYKGRIEQLFDRRAGSYDTGDTYHPPLAEQLLRVAAIQPGERCLDLATGTGLVAIEAAAQVGASGSVLGLDISSAMLAEARRKAAQRHLANISFQQGDAEEVELDADSFDVITCSSAIIYLADVPAALSKLHRWLKPGGRLIFNTPQEPCVKAAAVLYELVAALYDVHLADAAAPLGTADKAKWALQAAGFASVQVTTTEEVIVSPGLDPNAYSKKMWRTMSSASSPFTPIDKALTAQQIEQLEGEFLSAAAKLATRLQTDKGIENPYTMLWVVGCK